MFWMGFFSIYLIFAFLGLLMHFLGKMSDKFIETLKGLKSIACAVVFTLFSYVFTLLYSMVSILTGNICFNAILCAIFLVFSWFMVEKFYQLIAVEKCDEKKETKTLTKEDKNICNLFALIGVILSCIVRNFQDGNSEYIVIISIAISIWIGAYIPLSSIYEGETLKKLILKVIADFESKKSSVYISAIVSTIITTILVLKNEFVVKLHEIIEQFGRGVAIGSMVLILLIIIFSYIRSKRVQKGTI
jgi:hypothetical protein